VFVLAGVDAVIDSVGLGHEVSNKRASGCIKVHHSAVFILMQLHFYADLP
jgi:hypothetical protein